MKQITRKGCSLHQVFNGECGDCLDKYWDEVSDKFKESSPLLQEGG